MQTPFFLSIFLWSFFLLSFFSISFNKSRWLLILDLDPGPGVQTNPGSGCQTEPGSVCLNWTRIRRAKSKRQIDNSISWRLLTNIFLFLEQSSYMNLFVSHSLTQYNGVTVFNFLPQITSTKILNCCRVIL